MVVSTRTLISHGRFVEKLPALFTPSISFGHELNGAENSEGDEGLGAAFSEGGGKQEVLTTGGRRGRVE